MAGTARPARTQRGKTKDEIARELDLATGNLAAAQRQIAALEEAARKYQGGKMVPAEKVREVALRVADEQGWCEDGVREALEEIGVDTEVHSYDVEVSLKITVTPEEMADDTVEKVREEMQEQHDYAFTQYGMKHFAEFEVEDVTVTKVERIG